MCVGGSPKSIYVCHIKGGSPKFFFAMPSWTSFSFTRVLKIGELDEIINSSNSSQSALRAIPDYKPLDLQEQQKASRPVAHHQTALYLREE